MAYQRIDTIKIVTNGHHRELQCLSDIPAGAAEDFDYIDEEEHYSPRLVQYRGAWYDINDMIVTSQSGQLSLSEWEAYASETFFSGVVVRFVPEEDYEVIQIGTYICKSELFDDNE